MPHGSTPVSFRLAGRGGSVTVVVVGGTTFCSGGILGWFAVMIGVPVLVRATPTRMTMAIPIAAIRRARCGVRIGVPYRPPLPRCPRVRLVHVQGVYTQAVAFVLLREAAFLGNPLGGPVSGGMHVVDLSQVQRGAAEAQLGTQRGRCHALTPPLRGHPAAGLGEAPVDGEADQVDLADQGAG